MTIAENCRFILYQEVMKIVDMKPDRDYQGTCDMIDNALKFGIIDEFEKRMLENNIHRRSQYD